MKYIIRFLFVACLLIASPAFASVCRNCSDKPSLLLYLLYAFATAPLCFPIASAFNSLHGKISRKTSSHFLKYLTATLLLPPLIMGTIVFWISQSPSDDAKTVWLCWLTGSLIVAAGRMSFSKIPQNFQKFVVRGLLSVWLLSLITLAIYAFVDFGKF